MDTKDGLTIAGTTIFHFFREISLLIFCVLISRKNFKISGALFTSGGLNQLASNGIIHSIEDVIYPYVSDEVATTPKPKFRLREERS